MNLPSLAYVLMGVLAVFFFGCLALFAILFFRDSTFKNSLLTSEKARLDSQERSDRLMEALARQGNVDLVMPSPQAVNLERSDGWWDHKPKLTIRIPAIGKEKDSVRV